MSDRRMNVVLVMMAAALVLMAVVIAVRCCQERNAAPLVVVIATPESVVDPIADVVEPPPTPTCVPPGGGEDTMVLDPFGKQHCRGEPPKDPGGHVMDSVIMTPGAGPTPVADGATEVTLFSLPGMVPDPLGMPHVIGRCYNMNTKPPASPGLAGNWENVPVATAAQIITGIQVPAAQLGPPPAANPDMTDPSTGLYGWWAPHPVCYFVRAIRPGQAPRYSPIVGIVNGVADVTDLHHCWPANRWGSDLTTICR